MPGLEIHFVLYHALNLLYQCPITQEQKCLTPLVMKPVRCIIVDDDPLAVEGLRFMVKKIPFLDLLYTFNNPEEATGYLYDTPVDLIISDIEMPGLNGIDWLRTLEVKPLVIFITAHAGYALAGFELNARDYLIKPFTFERFYEAVVKAQEYLELKYIQHHPEEDKYIFIRCDGKFEKILLSDILYIEGLKDYVKIVLRDIGKTLVTAMNVKTIAEKLPFHMFIRIHRSYLVNVNRIKSVDKHTLCVQETALPIGDSYKKKVFKLLIEEKWLRR
jgi:two-component system LytT family response regulator